MSEMTIDKFCPYHNTLEMMFYCIVVGWVGGSERARESLITVVSRFSPRTNTLHSDHDDYDDDDDGNDDDSFRVDDRVSTEQHSKDPWQHE